MLMNFQGLEEIQALINIEFSGKLGSDFNNKTWPASAISTRALDSKGYSWSFLAVSGKRHATTLDTVVTTLERLMNSVVFALKVHRCFSSTRP